MKLEIEIPSYKFFPATFIKMSTNIQIENRSKFTQREFNDDRNITLGRHDYRIEQPHRACLYPDIDLDRRTNA